MLKKLHIKNLALIDEIEITFDHGLNVITGETGAGKSILIGALALALGDRFNPGSGRSANTLVEAEFEFQGKAKILKREVRLDGRTKAWIDGSPVNISTLREEAKEWVDLTAQREGISLLDPETHIHHLDRIANLGGLLHDGRLQFQHWETITQSIKTVQAKLARLRETNELAAFQLEEIEKFAPAVGEDEELDRDIRLLEGAESLLQGLGAAVEGLDQGENAIADQLALIVQELESLTSIDDTLAPLVNELDQGVDLIRDVAQQLASRRDTVDLDPEKLEELRNRRGLLSRLIRKYGGSMESLLESYRSLQDRESGEGQLLQQLRTLKNKLHSHLLSWEETLEKLSSARKKSEPTLIKSLLDGLRSVGIEQPGFQLKWLEPEGQLVEFPTNGEKRVSENGWDNIIFEISFNPGQPLMPIQQVASGGELSRVMLLLKSLHPPEKTPPVLIFDEIDTGISGRTARQVGLRLKKLAEERQVLLVTHLPQIASLADHHTVVEKVFQTDETVVSVREVEIGGENHIEEIARLVGGEKVTEASRATARELIEIR
ncbi:DNA repair protein RecN [bacterium]|nr:DNA repair protein RecN [bacterium]